MEFEENNNISFFDILLRNKDGSILDTRCLERKHILITTFMWKAHHHPSQKMGVLKTLFTRALRISNANHVEEEIEYLKKVFLSIGYKNKDIIKTIKRARTKNQVRLLATNSQASNNKPYLRFIQGVTDKLAKVLRKNGIETSYKPLTTIRHKMRYVKDDLDHFQQKDVYKVVFMWELLHWRDRKTL